MAHTASELEQAERRRQETSDRIVESGAHNKLIIAGPGTGKTFNFRRALEAAGSGGLALTFIRALVRDLERDLGDLAQVNTFHGFCKHLAHRLPLDGLTSKFDYYPPLLMLIAEDLRLLGHPDMRLRDLERALHNLDESAARITEIMRLGSYYDAVSHADVVYRVYAYLNANTSATPEFPLVVVDEYQDFCRLEIEFIELLRATNPVLVAGDDDQALYAFKDASPEFIRGLAHNAEFERFDLPYCSRCTEVIVDAVNNVVKAAQAENYPTALVIGRRHFVQPTYDEIRESFPNAVIRTSPGLTIDVIDAYRRLAYDAHSQVGWRILLHEVPFPQADSALAEALAGETALIDVLPDDYREEHLAIAENLRQLVDEGVTEQQIADLETAIARPFTEIENALGRDEEGELEPEQVADEHMPSVVCTSLLGAKGLSAGHVFIVGFNDGVFPSDPRVITDDEVCKLIVGLSRTRKQCHLISCRLYAGATYMRPSTFLEWLDVAIEERTVDKNYWSQD